MSRYTASPRALPSASTMEPLFFFILLQLGLNKIRENEYKNSCSSCCCRHRLCDTRDFTMQLVCESHVSTCRNGFLQKHWHADTARTCMSLSLLHACKRTVQAWSHTHLLSPPVVPQQQCGIL